METGNGDQEDVAETASWSCPVCPASGSCAPGDELVALLVHMTGTHN
jgi:hypothetical protein